VSQSHNPLKSNPITKARCKARLNAYMCVDGTIIVSSGVLDHKHELSPS